MRGQRLLDNAPCQAVAGLDSGALLFPRYCASLVQTKADRHANGSPSGGAGEELATRLRGLGRCQTALRRDSIALIKSLPIAAPAPLSCRACPLRHCFAMPPLPKGEALAGPAKRTVSPEAPLLGELSAKQTERLYEGEPDRKPLLNSTSPSRLRRATSPTEGRPWQSPQSERFRQRLPY